MSERILAREAKGRKSETFAKWSSAKERFEDRFEITTKPSFKFEKGSTIFTIGSCFARNIEERLDKAGFDVPMLEFSNPKSEYAGHPRGMINKYTPTSIYAEISWAETLMWSNSEVTPHTCQTMMLPLEEMVGADDPMVIDLNLGGFEPVPLSRFLERRQQIYDLFVQVFRSDIVVITLGLIEAWVNTTNGEYVQQAPIGKHFKDTEDKFAFVQLSTAKCLATVKDIVELIRRHNSRARILLTVSPVPLGRTFTQQDVVLANMQSKSVLRAVAGEVCSAYEQVDYFPSYELVMLDPGGDVWDDDRRHVKGSIVDRVVDKLLADYS